MADLLPVDTDRPGIAGLAPAGIAQLDVPLAQLSAEIDERTRRLIAAEQRYDMHHLDADSSCVLSDCQYTCYLPGPAGGQS
ncbi:hypothetical protein AB0M92_18740 [Streptomyces sp. NPDC051582]|uniref:hypothetical protein n=1 Tax=Streptomyces sp. NPDC051582 TaxID=3155167 RepID=UPI003424E2E8